MVDRADLIPPPGQLLTGARQVEEYEVRYQPGEGDEMVEFTALTDEEREQYERIVELVQTRIIGAQPVLIRCQFDGRDVAVLGGHVHADLTDDGQHQLWPEAILIDDELFTRLEIDSGELGIEKVVNPTNG